jgi:hypothetical protein
VLDLFTLPLAIPAVYYCLYYSVIEESGSVENPAPFDSGHIFIGAIPASWSSVFLCFPPCWFITS